MISNQPMSRYGCVWNWGILTVYGTLRRKNDYFWGDDTSHIWHNYKILPKSTFGMFWRLLGIFIWSWKAISVHIELAVWIFIPSCVWFSQPSPYPHMGVSSRTTSVQCVDSPYFGFHTAWWMGDRIRSKVIPWLGNPRTQWRL